MREELEIFGGDDVVFVEEKNLVVGGLGRFFLTEFGVGASQTVESGNVCRRISKDLEIEFDGVFPGSSQGGADGFVGKIVH